VMLGGKTLETNWKLDVAGTHDVLDLEIGEFCVEAKFLNDTGVLARRKF
jgi:hypothetical protein